MATIKLFIISAGAEAAAIDIKESAYACAFDENYAQRFIRHLSNAEGVCTACGDDCIKCRYSLAPDLSDRIAGHLRLPVLTDQFIDDPDEYLPGELPPHDITIVINIHSDLLLEVPARAAVAGSKALIVPVESPDWLGGWAKGKLEEECAKLGLEFAAPKPFCSLTGDGYTYIKRFIEEFKVGLPEIEFTVEDGVVKHTRVITSAPCGATYYLARTFKGLETNAKLLEAACKCLSSYPCTASTKIDPEFKDSITHKANYIMMDELKKAIRELQ